jgi:uncharacterized membrane protein YesL
MGNADRLIRTLVALGIILFYQKGLLPQQAAPTLLIIAGVLIITSIFAVCPFFYLFSISTSSRKKANE